MSFVNPAHVKALLIIAAHLSGYSVPADTPPVVEEISSQQMDRKMCGDQIMCPVLGVYADGSDHIYVDGEYLNSLDAEVDEDSVIVHELTHWLQDKDGQGGYACPHRLDREYQAYQTQLRYIVRVEHKPAPDLVVPSSTCGPVQLDD